MDENDEIILNDLDDEELVLQMHDDLYDGLRDGILFVPEVLLAAN